MSIHEIASKMVLDGTSETTSGMYIFYRDEIINWEASTAEMPWEYLANEICFELLNFQEVFEVELNDNAIYISFWLKYCTNLSEEE